MTNDITMIKVRPPRRFSAWVKHQSSIGVVKYTLRLDHPRRGVMKPARSDDLSDAYDTWYRHSARDAMVCQMSVVDEQLSNNIHIWDLSQ